MKKLLLFLLLLVLAITNVFDSSDPPRVRQEITDPKEYLNVNRYVKLKREQFFTEGELTPGFLPDSFEDSQVQDYLYWYQCALFGDPNYAISITLSYPTKDEYNAVREIILGRGGTLLSSGKNEIWCTERAAVSTKELVEYPLLDGCMYWLEYAYLDEAKGCVTYTEAYLWEGQIHPERIDAEILEIYNLWIAEANENAKPAGTESETIS